LALAITLVVVVVVLSLAVNAQGPFQGTAMGGHPRTARVDHPGSAPPPPPVPPRAPRRPPRERGERGRERSGGVAPASGGREPEHPADADAAFGDLKPLNSRAQALVMSVIDERTLGPVTRSRLTLRVEPKGAAAFEVTTRVAFPTLEDRARVKVGETIPVRYDPEDHRRVVVDTEKGPGE
jgi:hypothetical protein